MENKYITKFSNYMLGIKGNSENTIKVYESALKEFFNFIYQDREIDFDVPVTRELLESINRNDGRAYLGWCASRGNGATTRNRKSVTLRTFYKYLEDSENIKSDIVKLDVAKAKKTLPKYLTENEAFQLLRSAKKSKRDYAIILMFLTSGLRVSEMASLNRDSIRPDNTMVITGKGNKQRVIYLPQECVDAVNEYLSTRTDDNIFMWSTSNTNKRMAKNTIQYIVKSYLKKIGREDCSVHKLRHTFATLMYQSGSADLLQLQQMLGHNDVSTTQIYTHVADSKLAECVKHNPLLSKPNLVVLAG